MSAPVKPPAAANGVCCPAPAAGLPQSDGAAADPAPATYRLEEQAGFLLRLASQRHTAIFGEMIPGRLTPMQFAALAKLAEVGETSQNELGRMTAMDVATIKGVVDRLRDRGLVASRRDQADRRRILVGLSPAGRGLIGEAVSAAHAITRRTTEPLTQTEAAELCRLLSKIS